MLRSQIVADFDGYLEKATNPMQLDPDEEAVAKIIKMIDNGTVEPADAVQAIHGKIIDDNPHTTYFALKVLEVVSYKCGSLVHKVICTSEYMDFLRDIIQSTEHKKIKIQIIALLNDWAQKFKNFPRYSAPEKLLKFLQDGNSVTQSKNFQINNGTHTSDLHQANMSSIKNTENNYQYDEADLLNSKFNKKSLATSNNTDLKNMEETEIPTDDRFQKEIEDYRKMKKKQYKLELKSQGKPTSSDEEDVEAVKNRKVKFDTLNTNVYYQKEEEYFQQNSASYKKLPKDLEEFKKQRQQLNATLTDIRAEKHENFVQNCTDEHLELKKCQSQDCKLCAKKPPCEEAVVIPKRLPVEIRKVKESKLHLKKSYEEYKEDKKQAYYNKQSNLRSNLQEDINKDFIRETEDEDIKKALLLSQIESKSPVVDKESPKFFGDLQEERMLHEAMELSLLETKNADLLPTFNTDAELLQKVIDLSFAEAEEKEFSPMPKVENEDDDMSLYFAKLLSLEAAKKKSATEFHADKNDIGSCNICFDKTLLKSFKPCNHKCICSDCATKYVLQICLVCRKFYTTIL